MKITLSKVINYIYNRFISKTHYLPTNLTPGKWYEFDDRLFHGMFGALVDFVEIEVASEHDDYPRYGYLDHVLRIRRPVLGVNMLAIQSKYVYDKHYCDSSDPKFGTPTQQAITARQVLELYLWWMDGEHTNQEEKMIQLIKLAPAIWT